MYQCRVVTNLIENLKSYTSVIQENASDQKVLLETVNKLPQKETVQHYPSTQVTVLPIFSKKTPDCRWLMRHPS